MNWRSLAEHQIRKAQREGQREGQLDNLPSAGKPVELAGGQGAEAVGFRIMADAGVLSREIELKIAADTQRLTLQKRLARRLGSSKCAN